MYVAIDIGGTNTRIAHSNSLVDVTISDKVEYRNSHNFLQDISTIEHVITSISHTISSIGIGIPGDINEESNIVFSANWNKEYEHVDLVNRLSKQFNCPVYMNNDAVVASLGVAYYGNGKNNNFIYINWGTGIGGTVVKGEHSKLSAEQLDWDNFFENWEKECGGQNIETKFNKPAFELSEDEWNETMVIFKKELFSLIEKIPSVKLVIFGGGISVKQEKRIYKLKESSNDIDIRISSLGDNTGLYGSFGLLRTKLIRNT